MNADCTFCKIVSGDIAAHVVLDDDVCVGFLDARPVFHGHTLLVPREHFETLADLPEALVEPVFSRAKAVATAVRDAMEADGSFVAINNIVSQSVPHLHVHIVPRKRKDGLRGFFWPRQRYTGDAQAGEVAAAIRARLA